MPDYQRERLTAMGFGEVLSIEVTRVDTALLSALHERWDPVSRAFIFPLGHMIPIMEDIARITGLRVHGRAVIGFTFTDYWDLAQELPGLALERSGHHSSQLSRSTLQESLGLWGVAIVMGELPEQHIDQVIEQVSLRVSAEVGPEGDRVLRHFLILLFGKLLSSTRTDVISYRLLPLLQDLDRVGRYTWGAAVLAFLFESLGSTDRETMLGDFSPFL